MESLSSIENLTAGIQQSQVLCMHDHCLPVTFAALPAFKPQHCSIFAVCSSCISDDFDKLASLIVVSIQQSGLSHDGTGCPDRLLPAWAEFNR